MATVTGFTAERMLEIEGSSVVDGEIVDSNLILTKHDGTEINAGPVTGPEGPPGPAGPAINAIPGEVKLWSGETLPDEATYGKWVWADGAWYEEGEYPLAAAHISPRWKTFDGASDPGSGKFRVPDLRGLVAAGLDAMPGGTRKNRVTRAAAVFGTSWNKTGKETHIILTTEMPSHTHVSSGGHLHIPPGAAGNKFAVTKDSAEGFLGSLLDTPFAPYNLYNTASTGYANTAALNPTGGGGAHENLPPSVFVPYIVCLGS